MKTIAAGIALAAFAATPAFAECSFSHMAKAGSSKAQKPQMSVAEVKKAPVRKLEVASIPMDAWLIRHLDKSTG